MLIVLLLSSLTDSHAAIRSILGEWPVHFRKVIPVLGFSHTVILVILISDRDQQTQGVRAFRADPHHRDEHLRVGPGDCGGDLSCLRGYPADCGGRHGWEHHHQLDHRSAAPTVRQQNTDPIPQYIQYR